jgi:RNA polymerase sigma factor (sigma-70 family)
LSNTKTYTEAELVKAVSLKDRNAFTYLYNNYSAALYGNICKIITDTTAAEDALQEVFVKIWNSFESYDASKGRIFTWMLNISRNYAIDVLRSKGHKQQQLISHTEAALENRGVNNQAIGNLESEALQKEINKLNNKQQQVIDLAYLKGFNQEEMAKILDIPIGTVKSRVRGALIELRKIMLNKN